MLIFYFGFDREPMNSWIMKQWLKTHNKEEYPDLSITQGNDAFHVLEESCHPPEESIERMCSPEFFSKHKYKYVESPMNIKLDQTFEDCGNPLASPLYEEPVLRHSQACAGKIVARNEDIALDYAYPMNEEGYQNKRSPPFSIHNKNQTSIPMGTEHQCPRENRGNQVDMTEKSETESNQSKTELQEQEGDEEDIDGANAQSSDLEHNENVILEEVPNQDQTEVKNALVKDSVNITYASLTIHDKKPTRMAKKEGYQFSLEHRLNKADLTEREETQSYQSRKTKSQHEREQKEEVIYEFTTPSSDLEHNENATLEEAPKQDQRAAKNALVKDNVNITYASLTIHDKKPTRMAKKEGYQFSVEHRLNKADLTEKEETQSYQSRKTKSQHEREQKEEVIYEFTTPSSDLEHNENATLEEAPKQDQRAAKNALVKDNVNITSASLTIHDKKPTRMAKKEGYQFSVEHRLNQADLTEKEETQSYQSRKTKSQHEREQKEEVIYEFTTPSSDLEHNENATLEEAPKQDQKAAKNALVKDNVNITYASLTIHDKKPTRMAKKEGYQFSVEHRLNQAGLTEKDETQSYHYWKKELHHGQEEKEEVVYEFTTPSSDLEYYEKAILGEVPKQDLKAAKNALVKDSVNLKNASLTIHDKKPTRIAKKEGYQFSLEHRLNQADLTKKETQSYQSRKTELQHEREEKEEVINEFINPSSDLEHNENAILEEIPKQDQKAAESNLVKESVNIIGASFTIHDKKLTAIPEEVRKQEETVVKHASVEDAETTKYASLTTHDKKPTGISKEVWKQDEKAVVTHASVEEAETTKYQSLTVHFKELTGVPKERENQCPREHCGYEAPLTEKGKTESKRSKTKTKFQPIHEDDEGDINGCIAISFRNSQEEQVDANGNLEDEEEIARLEEICNQKEKVSQEGTVRIKYPQEDGTGALRKDTPMTHTLRTDKIKEEDQEAQNLQPVGDGTERKVDHQPSGLRRTNAIRRKTKSSETKKLAMRKANNKQNKENVKPECDSKEVVHDQVLKEVNEEHRAEEQNLSKETSRCLPQAERSERCISVFNELAIDIGTSTEEI